MGVHGGCYGLAGVRRRGGGGSGQLTGQFVDDPVEGLTYQCVSSGAGGSVLSGNTNALGQFSYLPGQTCTFKVGSVVVGSVAGIPVDGLVTPQDVAGVARSATSAPTAAVIAQFLQSLSEPGSSGKIKISAATAETLARLPEISLVGSTGPIAQDGLRTLMAATGKTLVSATQAAAALNTSMSSAGVSLTAGSVSSTAHTLNSVTVSAAAASVPAGAVLKLTAMANMSDGNSSVVSGSVTWSSSDTSLATVASDGTVTTRKPGKVKISAVQGGLEGVMEVTVTQAELQALAVPQGQDDPLPLGVSRPLVLVGTYSDGSQQTLTQGVSWVAANSNAQVSSDGVLSGVAIGAVNVTGTVGAVSQTFSLRVSPAVLRSIALSRVDGATSSVAAGRTVQFKASGTYSDGSEHDITSSVNWSAGSSNVSVSNGGVVTTSAAGTGRVSVQDPVSQLSANSTLVVSSAVLESLVVRPTALSLAEGLNQVLSVTGTYSDGTTSSSLSGVTWSSSEVSKVNVANNGLASGQAVGSAVVTARVGDVSGQLTVTVTAPVAQSLSLSSVLTSISNGASTVLNAVVTLTNGVMQAVASAVTWVVDSLGGQASISVSGDTVTLLGTAAGDVTVRGTYQGVSGSMLVKVLPSISGVAASGAPMDGASVTLLDATGQTLTITANDVGGFTFTDLTGYRAPFQISATAQVGAKQVTQYSIYANALADGNNTVNVTPLTSAIAALVAPSGVIADMSASQLAAITPAQVSAITSQVVAVIAPLASNIAGMPSTSGFDPVTTVFAANGTGADRLLDFLDVSVRPDGVAIANKMAIPTADSTANAAATLAKGGVSSVTPLAPGDVVNLDGIDDLVALFKRCFTVSSSQRLTNKTANSATLVDECRPMALPAYLHNGNTFMSRWAGLLNTASMNASAKFSRPEFRLRLGSNPDVIAVNFNMVDKDGVGYTLPEIIQKQPDGSWRLYGNQRKANAFVETSLINYRDMVPNTAYNNINYSRLEVGLRFNFDPRMTFSNGEGTYQGIDLRETGGYATTNWSTIRNTGATMVKCVAVMGPGNFSNGAKWMGIYPYGLLLKKPTASVRQDYMAIDRRLSQGEQTALLNAQVGDNVASGLCPQDNAVGGTEGGFTASSSSTYAVDLQPLINQKHPLSGQVDATINGRDRAWYTGARYARVSPDADLTAIFQNNPKFTFYVVDTNNILQMKIDSRYLGELPSLAQFSAMVQSNKLPEWSKDSLRRYLDFTGEQPATSTITMDWVNPTKGFNTDYAGLYSEVYQSTSGAGLRGASSVIATNRNNVVSLGTDGLWSSDSDLAAYIDALPGTNFFWRYSTITKVADGNGNCTGNYLSSTGGFGVYRSIQSINAQSLASNWLGTDTLQTACRKMAGAPSPTTNAYVMREMYLRTYSDKNARVYNYVSAKKMQ